MKKILIFFLNPGLLIPVLSIAFVIYTLGTIQFDWFKKYKEYSVNVCIRTLVISDTLMKDTITDDGTFKWFVVCGLLKDEIENNNKPGLLVNGQRDVYAGFKTKIKCLTKGKCSMREKRNQNCKEIINYGKLCSIEKLYKMNNGKDIKEINPGLKRLVD